MRFTGAWKFYLSSPLILTSFWFLYRYFIVGVNNIGHGEVAKIIPIILCAFLIASF